jgi:hypothetical protein
VAGFEPATPSSRTRCATRLRYTPTSGQGGSYSHAIQHPQDRLIDSVNWTLRENRGGKIRQPQDRRFANASRSPALRQVARIGPAPDVANVPDIGTAGARGAARSAEHASTNPVAVKRPRAKVAATEGELTARHPAVGHVDRAQLKPEAGRSTERDARPRKEAAMAVDLTCSRRYRPAPITSRVGA